MPDPLDNLHDTPLPPIARPSALPGIFSMVCALAVSAWQLLRANGSGRGAALTVAAVSGGFFLGRRIAGAPAGLLTAAVLAALTAGFSLGNRMQLTIFLAVVGLWWTLRFRDDRAPANAIVALAAFAGLGWLATHGGW
jgi:hypothetical protein